MTRVTPRLRRGAAVVGVLPVLMLAVGQGASFATSSVDSRSATPTVGIGGNKGGGNVACPDGLETYKVEGGTLTAGTSGNGAFQVTLSNLTETTFDFSANLVVETLIVKGGSVDAAVTHPNSKTGSGTAPAGGGTDFGLSNVSFCYEKPVATSPSPSPAASVLPSQVSSPSPSPAASVLPSQVSSPSPSPAASVLPSQVSSPSPAVSASPSSNGGNAPCPTGTVSLKIDSDDLKDGTFTSADGQLVVTVDFNGTKDFDFTSNIPVTAVVVKGGPQANVITFTGPVMSGNDLNAGLNPSSGENYGLSNIQFCYVPVTTTPTSPSPSPAASVLPSQVSSPSPSPAASVLPSQVSSPSPAVSASPSSNGGNAPCPTGTVSLKIDSDDLKDGTFTSADGQLVVTVDFNGTKDFDFTSNIPVTAVVVKGGPQANVITFTGPVMSGNDLNAGLNPSSGENYGLSNIQFCYVPVTTTPTSPSPSPAASVLPSQVSSPSPSPAASVLPSQVSSPSPAVSASPSSNGGNAPCPTGTVSLKIDSDDLKDGTFTSADGQLVVTVDFNGTKDFDFTSNIPVTAVVVKGGPQANVITFTGPVMSGNDLNAGLNPSSGENYGLSNIQFCYVPVTTTPTSPSPSPAASVLPSQVSSPSPSPAASVLPSQVSSPSPAVSASPSSNGGNAPCPTGTVSLKIDSDDLKDGTFTSADGQLVVTVDFNGTKDFDFTSNIPVTAVVVKGGPQANVITFTGPVMSGNDLNAGLNPSSGENYGLSNIQFCYVPVTTTPTSPSPSPAASVLPSQVSSPSPSPAASVLPSQVSSPSPAVSASPSSNGGNAPCPTGTVSLKIDSDDLKDGTFTSADGQLVVTVDFNGTKDFDFTSNIPVTAVVVKGGPQANVITFTGPVMSGNDLNAGLNPSSGENYGLSNIQFCYVPVTTTPTSPSPSPAASVLPSQVSSPSPSPAASVLPSQVSSPSPSPSPSPAASVLPSQVSSPSPSPVVSPSPEPKKIVCPAGTSTLKIEGSQLQDGTYTSEDGKLIVVVDFTDKVSFDFTSNIPVSTVIVKGGEDSRVYTFLGPILSPVTSGNDLVAPINTNGGGPVRTHDISNVQFCYVPVTTTPTSPSPSPAASVLPSQVSSPSPSPAASVLPSQVSSPSPSPAASVLPSQVSSPSPSPAASVLPSQVSSPSPSPAASVLPTQVSSPSPSPAASVLPTQVSSPSPNPDASVLPTQVSSPSPNPDASVLPTQVSSPSPVVVPSPTSSAGGGGDTVVTPSPSLSPIGGVDEQPVTGGESPSPTPVFSPVDGGVDQPTQQSPPPTGTLPDDNGTDGTDEQPDSAGGPSALPFTGTHAAGLVGAAVMLLIVGGTVTYVARRREDAASAA